MERLIIDKKIGSGLLGDVYMCSIDKVNYAIKLEKIEENNLEYNLKHHEWREIEFSRSFGNFHSEYFVTLCFYDIINKKFMISNENYNDYITNCVNKTKSFDKNKFSDKIIKRLESKEKSEFIIRRLYSLVDDTLKSVIDSITMKQLYSIIVQISHICFLLRSNGYSHNDLHTKNIGIIKTSADEYIKISNKRVCSHGIKIKVLDFGTVMHEKYNLNETELFIHKNGLINDINRFLIRLITFDSTCKIKKIFNWTDIPDIYDNFFELINENEAKVLNTFGINKQDKFILLQLLFPEKFQKILLSDNFTSVSVPKLKIDLIDFLFIFKNKLDLKKIMKYFIKLANN